MSVNEGRKAGGFWGLVEQKGPWKPTKSDRERSQPSQPSKKTGGGIPIGGTKNAGHGGWYASITPYESSGLPPPPKPSQYVQKAIVVPSIMMPKTPTGTILRNAPVETLRPETVSVQKPGNTYVQHFYQSEVEAPRENTPSLMEESSVESDYYDPEYDPDYKAFEARVHEATRPPQFEFSTQTEPEIEDVDMTVNIPTIDTAVQTDPEIVDTIMTLEKKLIDNGVQTGSDLIKLVQSAKDLKVPDAKKLLTGIDKGKLPEKKSFKQNPTYNFEQAKKEFEEYTSQNRSKQTKRPEPSSSSRKESKRARSPEPVKQTQGPSRKTGLTEKQVYELSKRKVRILKKKQEQGRLVSNLANQLRIALQFIDKYESKRK